MDSLEVNAERYWSHVERAGPDDCWLWTGATARDGYGRVTVRIGGRRSVINAHRVALILARGEIGEAWALHHCDVRACCNPAHLYAGTPSQNVADMVRRGRAVRVSGERHGRRKLTAAQVASIRSSTEPAVVLAARFGVGDRQVRRIRSGSSWR